jgi:hypothetical protein
LYNVSKGLPVLMFGLPQLALDGAEDAQISIDDLNTPV